MIHQIAQYKTLAQFSRTERKALRALRHRYRAERQPFTACERAYLRFARWLRSSRHLQSAGHRRERQLGQAHVMAVTAPNRALCADPIQVHL